MVAPRKGILIVEHYSAGSTRLCVIDESNGNAITKILPYPCESLLMATIKQETVNQIKELMDAPINRHSTAVLPKLAPALSLAPVAA